MIYTEHTKSWQAVNTPEKLLTAMNDKALERFFCYVDGPDANGCRLWLGRPSKSRGYGFFWFGGHSQRAHRVSWMIHYGPIPANIHVCHECDVRLCVEPTHLFLGTNTENHQDKALKGNIKGEKHGRSILTEADVIRIRKSKRSSSSLAREYGVHSSTVLLARSGQHWSHVKEGLTE